MLMKRLMTCHIAVWMQWGSVRLRCASSGEEMLRFRIFSNGLSKISSDSSREDLAVMCELFDRSPLIMVCDSIQIVVDMCLINECNAEEEPGKGHQSVTITRPHYRLAGNVVIYVHLFLGRYSCVVSRKA